VDGGTKKRGLFPVQIARLGVDAFDWSIASQPDKPAIAIGGWRGETSARHRAGEGVSLNLRRHASELRPAFAASANRVARAHRAAHSRRDSMSFAGTHARVHACSTSRARPSLGGVGALRASRVSAPRERRGRTAAASSDGASSGSISASDATKFDALLAELGACPDADFAELVASTREQFTVSFYEHAAGRVEALAREGDDASSASLDRLCGRIMAAAETSFGEALTSSAGASVSDDAATTTDSTGLSKAERAELATRWDVISATLAREGEANAVAQLEKNHVSRRDSVVALLGRVPMGEKELRTLNMVTSERRIIDVLLTVPEGPQREETLTDALTPPPDVFSPRDDDDDDDDEPTRATRKQMRLDDDSGVLEGDEEEVFTTPARLLAAVELAVKESLEAGDDEDVVADLRALRRSVAARCDFL
jgi:hypothetical protein